MAERGRPLRESSLPGFSLARSAGSGLLAGLAGFVLDNLAPGEAANPTSYLILLLLVLAVIAMDLSPSEKAFFSLLLVFTVLFNPLGLVPGVDGLDSGVVMGLAGAMSGSGSNRSSSFMSLFRGL